MEDFLDSCGRSIMKPLLLLYLFVVRAAADCPKPQGKDNIVLTNEALLMNTFPENVKVTLECANGYIRENGTGIITCFNGNWTESDLFCRRKDCGPPKPQPHMIFNTSAGTLFGDVIKVMCEKGYQVMGSYHKQCFATGWTGGKTRCEIVTCDSPAEVQHGRSLRQSDQHPVYGEAIRYVCDAGYVMVGKDTITCIETGEYDYPFPECAAIGVSAGNRITSTSAPTKEGTEANREPSFEFKATVTEASTFTDSPIQSTVVTDKTTAASATQTASPSVLGGSGILAADVPAVTVSTTLTTSIQGEHDGAVDTNKDINNTPVIVSVVFIPVVVCALLYVLHKLLLRKKGSYDTREDLKPELLQFQNL